MSSPISDAIQRLKVRLDDISLQLFYLQEALSRSNTKEKSMLINALLVENHAMMLDIQRQMRETQLQIDYQLRLHSESISQISTMENESETSAHDRDDTHVVANHL